MITSIRPVSPKRLSTPTREDDDSQVQGLTPEQITILAQKVYDLLLEELRIEMERHGGIRSR